MEFDYIVIGAGSAGCAIAARLSEDPSVRVALVEAGKPDRNFMIHMPLGYGKTTSEPGESWHYRSAEEPGLDGRTMLVPRGKGVGGSSNINGMIYIRGQAADYDGWAQLGATGWGWADVLPWFRKAQTHAWGASEYRGGDGPLWTEQFAMHDDTSRALLKAFTQWGAPENDDFNGPDQHGAGWYHVNIKEGRRFSAAVAYLRPARGRANLTIMPETHIRRILLDGRRASGIEVQRAGATQTIKAGREVVLCAGAYHSPQILQLSGIGPGAHLQGLGIDVVADAPGVGANLQDHLMLPMTWRLRDGAFSYNREIGGMRLVWNVLRYLATRKGPMTIPAAEIGAFVKSDPALDRPDIQFHCLPVSGEVTSTAKDGKASLYPFPGLTLAPCQVRPESRGTSMAGSPDPFAVPHIVHNYLMEAEDQRIALAGMRIAREVMAQPAMAEVVHSETDPGDVAASEDDLLAYARLAGATGYHPVGTCRMGSDEGAVVDPQLRVRGIEGLRIADASVMPRLTSGNTHAASVMIGERAADMIRSAAR